MALLYWESQGNFCHIKTNMFDRTTNSRICHSGHQLKLGTFAKYWVCGQCDYSTCPRQARWRCNLCDYDECTSYAFTESDYIFTGPIYVDSEDEDQFNCNYIIEDEEEFSCTDRWAWEPGSRQLPDEVPHHPRRRSRNCDAAPALEEEEVPESPHALPRLLRAHGMPPVECWGETVT